MIRIYLKQEQIEWDVISSYRDFNTGPYKPKNYIVEWLKQNGIKWGYIILPPISDSLCKEEVKFDFAYWGLPCIEFLNDSDAILFKLSI